MNAKNYAPWVVLFCALFVATTAAAEPEPKPIRNTDEACLKDPQCVIVEPEKEGGGPVGQLTFYIPTRYSSTTYQEGKMVAFDKPAAVRAGNLSQAIACRDVLDGFAFHAAIVWEAIGGSNQGKPCDVSCQNSTEFRKKAQTMIPEVCKDVLPNASEVVDQMSSSLGLPPT